MFSINIIKRRYYLKRRNQRLLCKVEGYFHSDNVFRFLMSYLEDMPQHLFIVSVNRINHLYGLPTNVIPAIHLDADNNIDYDLISEYFDLDNDMPKELRYPKICSILISVKNNYPSYSILKDFDLLLLSGSNRKTTIKVYQELSRYIPVYLERLEQKSKLRGFDFFRQLPKEMNELINGHCQPVSMIE